MEKVDVIPSIVLSAHALARIAAQESGNDAPSAQWRALGILEREGSLRLGELATAARTTQPGMTRLIGTLDAQGLVSRERDPLDTRVTLVTATAAGLAALRAWRAEVRDTLAPRFADLTPAQWQTLEAAASLLAARTAAATPAEARA